MRSGMHARVHACVHADMHAYVSAKDARMALGGLKDSYGKF